MTARKSTPSKASQPVGAGSDSAFEFKSSAGLIRLASMAKAQPNQLALLDAKKRKDFDEIARLVTRASADDEAWDLLLSLPNSELETLYEEWAVHSGITVGESSAS